MKGILKGSMVGLFVFAMSVVMLSSNAWATSAFARKYGLACNTCHTVSFPRLNYYGEKFMRNGFQIPGDQDGSTKGKTAITDDLTLDERLGNLMGVRGKIRIFEKQEQDASGDSISSTVGSTLFGAIFASGTIAENIPVWMEFEMPAGEAETELANYFVGWTNIGGTSLANVRVGGFTPTEWTSFSDQKRGLDAYTSHPLALSGLGTTTGIEYYGYTGPAFWAVGVADKKDGNFNAKLTKDSTGAIESNKDVYIVLRGEMPEGPIEGSSISFLAYQANMGSEKFDSAVANPILENSKFRIYDLSANLRMGPLDLLAAYVWDKDVNTGSGEDDDKAYSIEADYKITNNLMGILRYDIYDDGSVTSGDSKTSYWTPAIVFAPRENLKITASYTLDTSDDTKIGTTSSSEYGEQSNVWDVELQFMF